MILIDTNIFVDHLRGHSPAVNFFQILEAETRDILFSAITEAELLAGRECNDTFKKEKLLHFLYRWEKVPVTNQVAALAGDICREHGLDVPDAIIAATALISQAELITKNSKHFKIVPRLKVRIPY